MKNVKDVFNKYEEKPSADLWERLSTRLDEEMPMTGNVSRLHRVKVWKWVAAALTVLVLGGAVSLGVFLQHRNNQDVIAENITENTDNKAVESPEAVMEQDEIMESEVTLAEVKTEDLLQPRQIEENSVREQTVQSSTQEESVSPKTNTRQVVLPPNSTLAIPMQRVMAVGDGLNDMTMLRAAGIRVAMGNAHPDLKAIATYITDDCDHDGAAKAIEHVCGLNGS